MVEPTKEDAVLDAGLAALGLVLDVVHLTRRSGLVTVSGPLAVLVPQGDRVADPGRNGLAVADVQRQAGAAQPGAELAPTQEGGEPAGAGQEINCLADDLLFERLAEAEGRWLRLVPGARSPRRR